MSPEQLKQLRELSERFEQGKASATDIQKLTTLLSALNKTTDDISEQELQTLMQ